MELDMGIPHLVDIHHTVTLLRDTPLRVILHKVTPHRGIHQLVVILPLVHILPTHIQELHLTPSMVWPEYQINLFSMYSFPDVGF